MIYQNLKFKIIFLAMIFGGVFGVAENSFAATINAASCSYTDVSGAITASLSGDAILIPSGSCTWSTAITIPDAKKLTLQGAGSTATVITAGVSSMLNTGLSQSRITGIGFVLPETPTTYDIMITVKGSGWRIDHCRFTNNTGLSRESIDATGMNVDIEPTGLIDNCTFINGRIVVNGMLTFSKMNIIFSEPLGLGSSDAVYIEDCTFTRPDGLEGRNCIDANRGGKYVFRYNSVNDTTLQAHSLQADNERGTRKWEIYNNTITTDGDWAPMSMRGGTGVIFNNTIGGAWNDRRIQFDNVRSCPDERDMGSAGWCDGTSSWDGNAIGENGYWCRDQIGRSTDVSLWTFGMTAPFPAQTLDAAYVWNNRYTDDTDITVNLHNCAESVAHIQENRDWFVGTPKPGYVPYTYPHPLREETDTTSPEMPSGLSVE